MAILKSNLEEPVFTRSERALVQSLHRAAQLHEGVKILESMITTLKSASNHKNASNPSTNVESAERIKEFLIGRMVAILNGYKLPTQPDHTV